MLKNEPLRWKNNQLKKKNTSVFEFLKQWKWKTQIAEIIHWKVVCTSSVFSQYFLLL